MGKLGYWLVLFVLVAFIWGWYLVSDNIISCTSVSIPYTTNETQDANILTGTRQIVSAGIDGVKQVCTKRATKDKVISETIISNPINKVIANGTKPIPTPEPIYYQEYTNIRCPVTTCNDGTCSYSTGRGTCSWHGGIAY